MSNGESEYDGRADSRDSYDLAIAELRRKKGASAYALGIIPSDDREKDDYYPTPPSATRALLSVERFDGPIWEPACGCGAMSREIEAAGYDVESTDLIYRGYGRGNIDFLLDYQTVAPNIVTNPPFKLAEEFARHALSRTTGKVAILARLAWLESKGRKTLFEGTPLASVWVFSERVGFKRGELAAETGGKRSGGMIAFAWFVWEHGYVGRPTLGWL